MCPSDQEPSGRSSRRYHSPRREEQARRTRARVTAAAARRFLDQGYAGTTMRAVASDAGVALPTVELAFGTKARLLKATIDTAIAGDDEPVPMLERTWAAQAQATAEPADFVAVFAQVFVDSAQRAAGLALAALAAAKLDAEIAAIAAQLKVQRETMATWLVDGLLRRSTLREGIERADAIDTTWALMDPALFCHLTRDRAWTAARFQRWFTDGVVRLLLPNDHRPSTEDETGQRFVTEHPDRGSP
jgi:AcrR family transcriptional regulator